MSIPNSAQALAHLSQPGLFAATRRGGKWEVVGHNPSADKTFFPVLSSSDREGDFYIGSASAESSASDAVMSADSASSVLDAASASFEPICVWYGNGMYWQLVYCTCTPNQQDCSQHCTEPSGTPLPGQTITMPCDT